jgi:hypothetical protein
MSQHHEQQSAAQLREAAETMISRLNARLTNEADAEAAAALLEIARYATSILYFKLNHGHPARPDYQILADLASKSYQWPAMLPAIGELRQQAAIDALPECLGASLPIDPQTRSGRGRTRTFVRGEPSGLAFEVFMALEKMREYYAKNPPDSPLAEVAAKLPPFGPESKSAWVGAGYQFVESQIWLENPVHFAWPNNIKSAVEGVVKSDKINNTGAFKKVIKKKLREGFAELYRNGTA